MPSSGLFLHSLLCICCFVFTVCDRAGGDADLKNRDEKTPAMLAEKAQNVQCTTILKMAQVVKEEKSHETRAAFLASMRDYDHALKATTIAKDLPQSMRAERAAELQADDEPAPRP